MNGITQEQLEKEHLLHKAKRSLKTSPSSGKDLLRALIAAAEEGLRLKARVRELEECITEILPLVREVEDRGPCGETWQSEELEAAIKRCDMAFSGKEQA